MLTDSTPATLRHVTVASSESILIAKGPGIYRPTKKLTGSVVETGFTKRLLAIGLIPGTRDRKQNGNNHRVRDLDIRGVEWKYFHDINVVGKDYRPLDASQWPLRPSGLLGPVALVPLKTTE